MHQRELALCHARCPVFLYSAKAHTVLPLRASSVVFLESSWEKNNRKNETVLVQQLHQSVVT